jgi:hypothetical protein
MVPIVGVQPSTAIEMRGKPIKGWIRTLLKSDKRIVTEYCSTSRTYWKLYRYAGYCSERGCTGIGTRHLPFAICYTLRHFVTPVTSITEAQGQRLGGMKSPPQLREQAIELGCIGVTQNALCPDH